MPQRSEFRHTQGGPLGRGHNLVVPSTGYDRIRQTHFERGDCNLADIPRMMSKIYADNLARSHSDSSRGIEGHDVAMQATGRDLKKINCHCRNKFGHYKNDCADFTAAHQQNGRRRQRQHKQRGGHQSDHSKPSGQHQQRGGGQMWCSYHKTTTHNDADCHARPANELNGNAYLAQVRPPSVPGICSSWDLPGRDDSDEKPCISFLAREVKPASKPTEARVEKEKGARPFGPVSTAATEGWRTRSWPFTPRAKPQPVTKPAKAQVGEKKVARPFGQFRQQRRRGGELAPGHLLRVLSPSLHPSPPKVRVEEEKGARTFGPVSTAATEGWRTRPWPFTPRAEQILFFGGPVAGETFGMANDEESAQKALMASSSVSTTSEDSANSDLATLMAPA